MNAARLAIGTMLAVLFIHRGGTWNGFIAGVWTVNAIDAAIGIYLSPIRRRTNR